jgi:hypothetical protein
LGQGWVAGSFCERIPFAIDDRLRVADGPLNLRSSAGLQADILDSLETGTNLIVRGGPQRANDLTWYEVAVEAGSSQGWLAGDYCQRIE